MEKLRTKVDISSYIDNSFIPEDKDNLQVLNSPVLNEPWLKITPADQATVNIAIDSAHAAFHKWKTHTSFQRGKLLRNIASKLRQNKAFLAEIMTLEIGKPIRESEVEVEYAAGYFDWYASEGERVHGLILPSHHPHKKLSVQYMPVGVCGLITPWNFPLAIPARKIAATLAAGCTAVLKPSPECPLSALALAYIATEEGVPAGVLNVVVGGEAEIGKIMLSSPKVRKLSFTGSCEVGKLLYKQSADTLKKMTMELGGHAPLIVFDDADIDHAVKETIAAKFRNSGQTCVAPNRLFIQDTVYDAYVKKLVAAVSALKVGDPRAASTDISNVLHPSAKAKLDEHYADAIQLGAKKYMEGNPSIVGEITPDMKVYHEETFGPLLPLIRFKYESDAIEKANDTEFGLAAYVFTQDLARADRVVRQLEYGVIGLNDGMPSAPEASFGGIKGSGFGREGGPHGIYDYLVEKCVSAQP
jgi:succinate-semialdehyde dehydrogenase/glutarate-semialdehyde dehydrogenase